MGDQVDPVVYQKRLSAVPILGTRFFATRDLSELVKQFVKGSKTLDYGCGPGTVSLILKSHGLDVDGVDINEYMIKHAKEMDPNGKYNLIESAMVPTSSEYYDLVYTSMVMMYCKTLPEMLTIVKEMARVLKPGGILMIAVPNAEEYYSTMWLHEDINFEENRDLVSGSLVKMVLVDYTYTTHHYYWTHQDYYNVIARAGLSLVCVHEPLGKDTDGFSWINEDQVAMTSIYIARKE